MNLRRICLLALLTLVLLAPVGVAQPAPGKFTIGLLLTGAPIPPAAFIQALRALGYEEGRNLTFVSRSANSRNEELPRLAAELVTRKPDLLVAMSTPPALALKQATSSIPIVTLAIADPVAAGLIQSLAHPGGNVTGTANAVEEWSSKRVQMVAEVLPGARCVLYLRNPTNQAIMALDPTVNSLFAKFELERRVRDVATSQELDRVLAEPLDDNCGKALYLPLDPLLFRHRRQITQFVLRHKLAEFTPFREDADAGALLAFGIDLDEQWRLGAAYVDKILKGVKPADLPVQQPVKFEMVVNLKTAKVLGLTIPPSILAQANEVIE